MNTYKCRTPTWFIQSKSCLDSPCGPVVKNPPYNAGDMGSIPGQGMWELTSHMPGNNYAHELQLESLHRNKRSHMPQLRLDAAK